MRFGNLHGANTSHAPGHTGRTEHDGRRARLRKKTRRTIKKALLAVLRAPRGQRPDSEPGQVQSVYKKVKSRSTDSVSRRTAPHPQRTELSKRSEEAEAPTDVKGPTQFLVHDPIWSSSRFMKDVCTVSVEPLWKSSQRRTFTGSGETLRVEGLRRPKEPHHYKVHVLLPARTGTPS
jgi:hypothetical protein